MEGYHSAAAAAAAAAAGRAPVALTERGLKFSARYKSENPPGRTTQTLNSVRGEKLPGYWSPDDVDRYREIETTDHTEGTPQGEKIEK